MKTLIPGSLVFAWLASTAWTQPAASNTNSTRVISPEIGPDRRVTFRLMAPKVNEVLMTGEFMRGTTNLAKNEQGLWSLTIGPLEPEIYNYNFTIDGVRTIDPGNPDVKTGSTTGTIGSILEVRGDRPAFYDNQPVPHGEIRTHWYQSKSLNRPRRLTVYTPPGYERKRWTRYPVVYLLHGANADEDAWHRLGHVNLILDNLLAAKKSKPFIVVMPFGYGVPPGVLGTTNQNTIAFSRDLIEDVIPLVQSQYRTYKDRDDRAIIGLSMGGGQALSIGLNHLELFSYVGGFSSGLGRGTNFSNTYASLITNPNAANKRLHLLWIGCGKEDGAFRANKDFSDFLTGNRIDHIFRESSGAHTWMVWRRYLNEISPLLFQ